MNFCWLCPWSVFRWLCQLSLGSWSSWRLDSNRILIRLSRLIQISGLNQFSRLTQLPGSIWLSGLIWLIPWSSRVNWMFSFVVLNSGFFIHCWLVISDLGRSCMVLQLILLDQISLANASEWFPLCSNLDLRRNPTVRKKFLQALRNLFPFSAHSDRTWA